MDAEGGGGGGKPQRDGTIFMGEVDPSRHPQDNWRSVTLDEMVKKLA